jgi:hypothetical protein
MCFKQRFCVITGTKHLRQRSRGTRPSRCSRAATLSIRSDAAAQRPPANRFKLNRVCLSHSHSLLLLRLPRDIFYKTISCPRRMHSASMHAHTTSTASSPALSGASADSLLPRNLQHCVACVAAEASARGGWLPLTSVNRIPISTRVILCLQFA